MSNRRKIFVTTSSLLLACFLLAGVSLSANEKKVEGKKKAEPKGPLLKKAEELKEDDEKDTKLTKSPCKTYSLKLAVGKRYQIDLKSKDFDTFLRLEDPAGQEVAFNDDADPSTLDSQIVYQADKDGEFKIIVASFDGKVGNFTLTVIEAEAKALPLTGSKYTSKAIELKLKDGKASYTGEFTEKDATAFKRYYKLFNVQFEKGKTYRIDHSSKQPEFDAYLFLEDADGTQLEADDDGGGGLNSRIVYKVAKTGTYRIIATTLPAGQTGKFTVEISPPDAKEAKEADLKFRISNFGTLAHAQRKELVEEVTKNLVGKNGNLTFADARVAYQLAIEAEFEELELARDLYKESIKQFSAARNSKVAAITDQFEDSFKKLDRLGKAIDINGTTVDGKTFDLKNLKGKVVLIDFWGTWCGPCVAEIPNIVNAYQKYHRKGFEVIGVSSDKADSTVVQFFKAREIPWPCINVEDSRKLIDLHEVTGFPTTLLVDQTGRVVSFRARGPYLDRLLEKLFAEKK